MQLGMGDPDVIARHRAAFRGIVVLKDAISLKFRAFITVTEKLTKIF